MGENKMSNDIRHSVFGELVKEHASGMKYYPPSVGIRGGIRSGTMRHFGTLLENPTFKTYDEFRVECTKLDSVRVEQAGSYNELNKQWTPAENNFALVSNLNNKTHSFVKERYVALQDKDLVAPLGEVCEQRKVNIFGRFDGVGSGRTHLTCFMNDPEYVVPLLHEHKDLFMLGLSLRNSYDKLAQAEARIIGVRMVCCNFGVHGDVMGKFRFKHFKDIEEAQELFGRILNKMIDKSPILSKLAEEALGIPVKMSDVPELLIAVGMPTDIISEIVRSPQSFAPEVDVLGLNAWTLYDMATASYTYTETRSKDMGKFTDEVEKFNELLTVKHDTLIERGRKMHDEILEELAKKERIKEKEKKKWQEIFGE